MSRHPLTAGEIQTRLQGLHGWKVANDKLCKSFEFADFKQAFAWMTAVAEEAERLDHHPTWTNTYKNVDVELNTHDANGITALDFELAVAMDRLQ